MKKSPGAPENTTSSGSRRGCETGHRRGCKLDDQKLRDKFLAAILDKEGVKKACKAVGISPAQTFQYLGREENREFKDAYLEAGRCLADTWFHEAVEIADD